MRFIHTSDLHIGKTVSGFSMLEEQEAALKQIMDYVKERQADAVLLSGDLYDRSVPPAAAVTMFDAFLTGLSEMGVTILAIAGNHDCGERIGFANRILEKRGSIWRESWKPRYGSWISPTSGALYVFIWLRLQSLRRLSPSTGARAA